MTQNGFVLLFVPQVALEKALLHLVLLANTAGANTSGANLSARITLGLVRPEVR